MKNKSVKNSLFKKNGVKKIVKNNFPIKKTDFSMIVGRADQDRIIEKFKLTNRTIKRGGNASIVMDGHGDHLTKEYTGEFGKFIQDVLYIICPGINDNVMDWANAVQEYLMKNIPTWQMRMYDKGFCDCGMTFALSLSYKGYTVVLYAGDPMVFSLNQRTDRWEIINKPFTMDEKYNELKKLKGAKFVVHRGRVYIDDMVGLNTWGVENELPPFLKNIEELTEKLIKIFPIKMTTICSGPVIISSDGLSYWGCLSFAKKWDHPLSHKQIEMLLVGCHDAKIAEFYINQVYLSVSNMSAKDILNYIDIYKVLGTSDIGKKYHIDDCSVCMIK